jgi:hypothetical protein
MKMNKAVSAILVGLMVLAFSAGAALAQEKTYELDVVGLVCFKDELVVSSILDGIIGIKDYEMDHMNSIAVITIEEDDISLEELDAKLDKKGYGINSSKELTQ